MMTICLKLVTFRISTAAVSSTRRQCRLDGQLSPGTHFLSTLSVSAAAAFYTRLIASLLPDKVGCVAQW